MLVRDIRKSFLEFFQYSHQIVRSSPLVPHNDPSLLFTNAGMVPFKECFTGASVPEYTNYASVQKCIRAGGKHNDLENVGFTTRHHTFFEMLGNFSFGGYFKEEAIIYAKDLLLNVWGLPMDRLLVTVFHNDDDAARLWAKCGFSEDKIIRINTKDNFWMMGDTGPCGPCTEIFYDNGPSFEGGPPGSIDQDGSRFVEIWNLVFMQFLDDESKNLPKPCIDTGMGLERVASIMQGTYDNFAIDTFKEIIKATEDITHLKADVSFRVIADHLRAASFLIADGITPSNEGRGYVLRRIIRRAVRHGYLRGIRKPLLCELVDILCNQMGDHYEELVVNNAMIKSNLFIEEEKFLETIGNGLSVLEKHSENYISGDIAFKLYDTFGFPIDLTEIIAQERNMTVDIDGFNKCLNEQRERSKDSWRGSCDKNIDDIGANFAPTIFLGYTEMQSLAKVLAILNERESPVIILDQSPFYAESGGQIGDIGVIVNIVGQVINVTNVIKNRGVFLHYCQIDNQNIQDGDIVNCMVDIKARTEVKRAHSATHILHRILIDVLGSHVSQKGSWVGRNKLRFDFSHHKQLTIDDIVLIEKLVNDAILSNVSSCTKEMQYEDALKIGAKAFFTEKYESVVRVVSFPMNDQTNSIELCGGTHVDMTGDIGMFIIEKESAVGSGVRRIEALCGEKALEFVQKQKHQIRAVIEKFKMPIEQLLTTDLSNKQAHKDIAYTTDNMHLKDHTSVVILITSDARNPDMRALAQKYLQDNVVFIIDKVSFSMICMSATNHSAIDILTSLVNAFDGKGVGGHKNFAQGGTKSSPENMKKLETIKDIIYRLCV